MRLHILGPAFGLPSIDAECIAAVALVKLYCQSTEQTYELVASYETSDEARLPLLEDGATARSGYGAISRYLTDSAGNISGLASDLAREQRGHAVALDSFITSTGLPLLDISLYVSYENYRLRTRSSFTQILPWYANFILPPRLRSAARARTAHLGISSIDIDTVHESVIDKPPSLQQQPRQFEEHETEKHAKRLLGQRNPLGSMLRASEHAAAFKVKALADAFFEPLEDALSSKLNLLGTNNISAIDCLAFGYLSLMLYPRMPQAWLELSLKNQYPKLKAYTDRLRTRFDMDTTVADAFQKEQDSVGNEDSLRPNNHVVAGKLPWTQPQRLSLSGAVTYVGRAVHRQLPFPNSGAQVKTQPVKDHEIGWLGNTILYLPALAAMAFTGYWFYLDRPWPRGEAVHHFGRRSRLGEFGAAGALLGGLDLQMYSPTAEAGSRGLEEYRDGKVTVEVVEDDEAI